MKSIGFKNFRRFVEFPSMRFNDITLMVGRNNSGKSTLVKAVLLVLNYLKKYQNQTFSFTTENVNDVNIVSFDRARCKLQSEDSIGFKCTIDCYDIVISISGDEHSIDGTVDLLEIFDQDTLLRFTLNFKAHSISIAKELSLIDIASEKFQRNVRTVTDRLNKEQAQIRNITDEVLKNTANKSYEYILKEIDEQNRSAKKQQEQEDILSENIDEIKYSLTFDMDLNSNNSGVNLTEYIARFKKECEDEKRILLGKREKSGLEDKENESLEDIGLVLESFSEIQDSINNFVKSVNTHAYYYWSAETQKQSALFSIRDNSNALAMAIHDFKSANIIEGEFEYIFVKNQLKEFLIGSGFELIQHVGEAYECNIVDDKGIKVSLADKGMGSIQIMTLLFRLATIIRMQNRHNENITLIIEEPELNLHPSLQSKLTSLFCYINERHNVKFIIETHSEYLIRMSQVIISKKMYKDTEDLVNAPISTYYFKSDDSPYRMRYRTDGKFSNEFGKGFFDEASNLAFEIF